MKKIIVFLSVICFSIFFTQAQTDFEGIIKWKITIGSTDNVSENKTTLSPQQQVDLKKSIAELESKMNDPQMKAMLDSNPAMKSMIEQQLATMKASGEVNMNALFPKSYTIKYKAGNTYTQVEGGVTAALGDLLFLKSTDKTYLIKQAAKTYSIYPKSSNNDSTTYTIKATTESMKVLGYTCYKYIVTYTKNEHSNTMFIWSTKELKQYNKSSFRSKSISNNTSEKYFDKIEGVPLKIEINEKGQKVALEVEEFKTTILPASTFAIPSDYKEVPYK
ncbi:DUF4412 domain-containing protein [uncultured Cytophaga sp.]|uniref:DUF4412 domain-containing protein n=1 Tax=uncultured Cytophaga sp. TaxID=160238 RepID=UPI0026360EE7|nr:DUF4412 domain-containing protein [uncultured Cytophaga sp.]